MLLSTITSNEHRNGYHAARGTQEVGVRVRVGVKVSAGVRAKWTKISFFCAHGASGTEGFLRPVPLATNYWPEAPWGGGSVS